MLCLSLLPGEYLTIGEDIVLQYEQTAGERCKLVIQAPREIPVVRGEVRERSGEKRPDCVFEQSRWYRKEIPWDRSKAQVLASIRKTLSRMDNNDEDVQKLRRQLELIFPSVQGKDIRKQEA